MPKPVAVKPIPPGAKFRKLKDPAAIGLQAMVEAKLQPPMEEKHSFWHRKEKKKRAEKDTMGLRGERQPRNKLFSEAHPMAYLYAATILPRIHAFIMGFVLLYAAMGELMKNNQDFIYDWLMAIPFMPEIARAMTSQEAFDHFMNVYGDMLILLTVLAFWLIVLFYLFAWRFIFKGYWKVSANVESPEGRVYWYESNMWYRLWDAIYRSPPRKTITFWIKVHWWPPINIFSPVNSMIALTISVNNKRSGKNKAVPV